MPEQEAGPGFDELPPAAAWRHVVAREGFEVAWFTLGEDGRHLRGHATGSEDGETWSVAYEIRLDDAWCTRWARVVQFSAEGEAVTQLESDGRGSWRVDGAPAPDLDGCLDVDLEASAMTNTLPVHRLRLDPGAQADAPAAYVRLGPSVERLDQTYTRLDGDGPTHRFRYTAPVFGVSCTLRYDRSGLVVDYPGLAERES